MQATLELLESEEETVNSETAAPQEKVEDLFESARQAFFSNSEGQDAPLSKPAKFVQVKSDGPVHAANNKK